MDVFNEFINDWKELSSTTTDQKLLPNQINKNIMDTFIALEQKEKLAKSMTKKSLLFLAVFLSIVLGIYALLNLFNATTIGYDLSRIILGSLLLVGSVAYVYFSYKVSDQSLRSELPTIEFIDSFVAQLKAQNRNTKISYVVLGILYPLGAALIVSGIFHSSFYSALIGCLGCELAFIIIFWINYKNEHKTTLAELEELKQSLMVDTE